MFVPTTTIARHLTLVAAATGLLVAAPAQASPIDLSAAPPAPQSIVMPQQIAQLAPAGSPIRDAAQLPRITFTSVKLRPRAPARRSTACRGLRGARLRRCARRHSAATATTDGLHYISPNANCTSDAVTFDYRDFWVSSQNSGQELIAVEDFAYYWNGSRWTLYSQDQMAYAWSGFQLATGWSTAGPNGSVVAATLGDGVRFGVAGGAAIRIAQFIGWYDASGRQITQSFDWLGHMNPGWFDFAVHPFCQY